MTAHSIPRMFDSDSDDEQLHICEEEEMYEDQEKINGQYYLGIYANYPHCATNSNDLLLANSISIPSFYKYPEKSTMNYLINYSIFGTVSCTMEIMKLDIVNDGAHDVYSVILKTYWLRMVQRHWKAICRCRKYIMKERKKIQHRHLYEVSGKYPHPLNVMPSIRGMMAKYAKNAIC
jgi:hypothetical protein